MKRQRSRGRNNKPGNQNPNRAYESTGPDIKVRGSAQTIFERYQQVGRDAMAAGDRVLAENYLQHAEHYLRLVKAIQPNFIPRSELQIAGLPSDFDEDGNENENSEDDNDLEAGEEGEENQAREPRENNNRNRYDRNNDENGRYNNRDNNRDNNRERDPNRDYNRDPNREQNRDYNRDPNRNRDNRDNRDNRNRGRDRYRNDYRNNGEQQPQPQQQPQENLEELQARPVDIENNEVANYQAPEQNIPTENTEGEPRRGRGVRTLRTRNQQRRPRAQAENTEPTTGFGEDLPAFLAPPSAVEAE